MLSEHELDLLMQELKISEVGQRVIKYIRSSPPSHRVGTNGKNMPVEYTSRKMGVMIQTESYMVELAGAHEMDHDPEVLEFYDQPPLDGESINDYCLQLTLKQEIQELIARIRDSPPSPNPHGNKGNINVWYPSKKMGGIIQAESLKVELPPSFLELEYSSEYEEDF